MTSLSIAIAGGEPPSEFRIFAAGENETTKGTFVFDAAAAEQVMAEYRAHGIDLALDYDHAMLDTGRAADPAQAGKAAGWFGLELRSGELWAVNVRWTEPAAEALRRKEWRFMSPAFCTDESGKISSLLNVAITNLPATRRLEPLMAASVTALGAGMDPELVKKALDALAAGDADGALAILKDLIAVAAGGEVAAEPAEPPAEELAEVPAEEPAKEEQAAVMAATSRLMHLTAKSTLSAAVEEIEVWRRSHLKLEAETQKLAKERQALELGKRKENAATLVKLGAETPHTSGLATGKLVKRLLDEPLDEQTKRVHSLLSARGGKLPTEIKPPVSTDVDDENTSREVQTPNGPVVLTARDLRIAKELKRTPEEYAALKRKG